MQESGRYADELASFRRERQAARISSEVSGAPPTTGEIAIQLTDEATAATITASRALLGVVARSVADALELVTLPQFRIMVILATSGPLRIGALAERIHVNHSTFSRTIDRMVAAGWVTREQSPDSRREVLIRLSAHGRQLVEHVTERRRQEIAGLIESLPRRDRRVVAEGFAILAAAAGEPPADDLLILGL